MDWFYVINHRRLGPVSAARLEELRQAGEIHEATLVWRRGFEQWQPLHAVADLVGVIHQPCVECRKFFPVSEMISLHHHWVCAPCKPRFLQRLAEGIAPPLGIGIFWRKDHLLIFHADTEFPDRCIRCNAPASGDRLRCQLQWAPTGRLVLSHMRTMVRVALCTRHRRQRWRVLAASWSVVLMGGAMICLAGMFAGAGLALGGLALIFLGLLALGTFAPLLQATRMADRVIWARGAGARFLAELPEWTGDR